MKAEKGSFQIREMRNRRRREKGKKEKTEVREDK